MTPTSLLLIGAIILGFGLISGRLEKTSLTPPMVFVGLGLLLCPAVLDVISMDYQSEAIHAMAELTLVLVLFTDASRIRLKLLRRNYSVPLRMLLIGMPLTLLLGTLVGAWIFPHWELVEVALLAALLMPTDAAVGQVVVSSELVPIRIRQSLNVESGLNDGIALPAVLLLASFAGVHSGAGEQTDWVTSISKALVFGPLVGIVVGFLCARLVVLARDTGWMNHTFQQLAGVSVALIAFAAAEMVHGNGFISAFVSGLVFGNVAKGACECIYEFAEAEGQLLALLAFLFFGAVMVPDAVDVLSPQVVGYIFLSLTVVRMLPIAISLLGLPFKLPTLAFLGWFGPRGLATILFSLLVMDEVSVARTEIFAVATLTVLGSVFLHGASALPLVRRYRAYLDRQDPGPEGLAESEDVPHIRLRLPPVLGFHKKQ